VYTEGESKSEPGFIATPVQTKYTDMLLRIPYVMGVAIGLQQKQGVYTDEVCLVVMVDKKVPADQLDSQSTIPSILDGCVRRCTGNWRAEGVLRVCGELLMRHKGTQPELCPFVPITFKRKR
jgi:hypothetical protein